MKQLAILFLVLNLFTGLVNPKFADRKGSYPYLSGDTFMYFCDHVFNHFLDLRKIKSGDKIFVKASYLNQFFKNYAPYINTKYILVTHNMEGTPQPFTKKHYNQVINDDKIIAWFVQNIDVIQNHKIIAIPLGFRNRHFFKDEKIDTWFFYDMPNVITNFLSDLKNKSIKKDILLYVNFGPQNLSKDNIVKYNVRERRTRQELIGLMKNKSFCYVPFKDNKLSLSQEKKSRLDFYKDLNRSKFVLSPPGTCIDCYRHWEALLMGSYPVMLSSTLDSVFKDLPVLIINNYDELTEEFLEKKYQEMKNKKYNMKKVYADYWFGLINSYKDR